MILSKSASDKGKTASGVSRRRGSASENESASGEPTAGGTANKGKGGSGNKRRGDSSNPAPLEFNKPRRVSVLKCYKYGGVIPFGRLKELLQGTTYQELWPAAALMQAVIDATSIVTGDGYSYAKPELDAEDARLLRAAAKANRNPVYQPVLDAMTRVPELGPRGIEAAQRTAALFVFFACDVRPGAEQLRHTYRGLLKGKLKSVDLWQEVDKSDVEQEV